MPHTFHARYRGTCDACDGDIEPGQEVIRTGARGVIVHAVCPCDEGLSDEGWSDPLAGGGDVCPTCNLIRPCDCEENDMREKGADVRIIEEGWKQLDAEVDEIMALAARANPGGAADAVMPVELELLKARARGKAEILAYAMNVSYPKVWRAATADDVSNEAGRRAHYRAAGQRYGTIGVESSTLQLTQTTPGWTLLEDQRGVLETSGGA